MPALVELDNLRSHEQASLSAALCVDAFEWTRGVLSWPAAPSDSHDAVVEHWLSQIETGVALHRLLAALDSSSPAAHFHANAQPGSFQARDNLASFGRICASKFHLLPADIFESDDLVLRKNPKAVALTILQLSRSAHSNFNVEPASSIKLEHEIQIQADEDKSRSDADEHEEQMLEISNDSTASSGSSSDGSGSGSGKVNEESKEAEIPSLTIQTPLDQSIASFIKLKNFKIRVVKFESHNKKTRRNENRKAEYLIGKTNDRVHVRLLHGVLVARIDDEWKSFESLVTSRL